MRPPRLLLNVRTVLRVLADLGRFSWLVLQSRTDLAAENLFLRMQLTLFLWNVTAHPTADWTAQQFRMIVSGDQPHRYVIHDRDSIYSEGVDRSLAAMGLTVLRTSVRAPLANTFCERLVGTIRRECLDFMIPLNQRHLR